MKLWVLRHGEAASQAPTDAQRELTGNGTREVLASAGHLMGQTLDAVLASPYVRAQQTAALVHDALRLQVPVTTVPWLTPDSQPQQVGAELAKLGLSNVLLVSHQPLVGTLISLLVHGSVQQPEPMQTASLAILEGEGVLAGAMTLREVLHSRQ